MLALYKTLDSQSPGKYIWALLFLISIALIVRVTVKKSYLELVGSTLVINTDSFQTKSVEVADIERIEIKTGPFSDSNIILKDNKAPIKFNYFNVNDKDFNQLMKQLNVPIN